MDTTVIKTIENYIVTQKDFDIDYNQTNHTMTSDYILILVSQSSTDKQKPHWHWMYGKTKSFNYVPHDAISNWYPLVVQTYENTTEVWKRDLITRVLKYI